jgi:hypothetical protein
MLRVPCYEPDLQPTAPIWPEEQQWAAVKNTIFKTRNYKQKYIYCTFFCPKDAATTTITTYIKSCSHHKVCASAMLLLLTSKTEKHGVQIPPKCTQFILKFVKIVTVIQKLNY